MSDCTEILGIASDATLQEIKRAYARALKANRPDDDPEAFGRVHAAFEACVMRLKRREAGLDDEPDWFDQDEDEYDESIPVSSSVVPAATLVPADEEPRDDAALTVVFQAVDAILEAAETLSPSDFSTWLQSDERLYDLGFKRHVGDLVLERVSERADGLEWKSLAALHKFFEVDSISDPRLRHDYEARQVWLRVQADARFEQGVLAKRSPDMPFADLIVLAELFDPPDRSRHLKMHLIPTLPGQLRNRFEELRAEDPERAEAAVSAQARDYWLPLTDPARLHPRRVALALAHCALLSLPFGLLLATPQYDWRRVLGIWGAIAGIVFAIWLARALFSFGGACYSAWRMRTVGAGEAPAGSNIFADRATAIAASAALLSLGLSFLALRYDKAYMGLILQVWLTMFMAIPTFRVPRFRWEAVLAAAAVAVYAFPAIRAVGSTDLEDWFLAVGPAAFATGVLAVLVLDAAVARLTRQALSDVRDAISLPQCILAVVAALAASLIR